MRLVIGNAIVLIIAMYACAKVIWPIRSTLGNNTQSPYTYTHSRDVESNLSGNYKIFLFSADRSTSKSTQYLHVFAVAGRVQPGLYCFSRLPYLVITLSILDSVKHIIISSTHTGVADLTIYNICFWVKHT